MSKLKVSAIHDPDNDNEAITVDTSGNVGISQSVTLNTNSSGYALKLLENSGGEYYQLGINSYGGLDIYNETTKVAEFDDSNGLQFNSGFGSVSTVYGVRAWVNFDGTSTIAIRKSGGVSSLTDNGTGNYNINLSFTMPDTKYAAVASGGTSGSTGFYFAYCWNHSTTYVAVGTGWTSGNVDLNQVEVVFLR